MLVACFIKPHNGSLARFTHEFLRAMKLSLETLYSGFFDIQASIEMGKLSMIQYCSVVISLGASTSLPLSLVTGVSVKEQSREMIE